jgi:hypothetical protein
MLPPVPDRDPAAAKESRTSVQSLLAEIDRIAPRLADIGGKAKADAEPALADDVRLALEALAKLRDKLAALDAD